MRHSPKSKTEDLFTRANKEAEAGKLRVAFHLYLAAAKAGGTSSQINNKRAYRRGDSCAAYNIGVMWRNDRKYGRALYWFKRAVRLGDHEANLEIAKHYLQVERNFSKAIPHLEKVRASNRVTEAGLEEARTLLRRTRESVKHS